MSSAKTRHRRVPGVRAWRSLGGRLALWYVFVTIAAFVAVAAVFAVRTDALVKQEGIGAHREHRGH